MTAYRALGAATLSIPLSRGYTAIADEADRELLSRYRWFADGRARWVYAVANMRDGAGWKHVYMHRLIAGNPAGLQVDHINRDTLDNRHSNLRPCDASQNQSNIEQRLGRSGYRGAYPHQGRWEAKISIRGRTISLGTFATAMAAAAAYDHEARKVRGEFARLNFPGADEQPLLVRGVTAAAATETDPVSPHPEPGS